jgi:hypothetical protein
MFRWIIRILLPAIMLSGCTPALPPRPQEGEQHLTRLLEHLDRTIPGQEASVLASDIIQYADILNHRFERTTDPKIHNFLVNIGIKEKGLCYQYSDALYAHLIRKHYPHFSFHPVGTHIGEFWREHNALVVTARGQRMEDGVIIDAWRESQRLFFSPVKEDRSYHWRERPERAYLRTADRSCLSAPHIHSGHQNR